LKRTISSRHQLWSPLFREPFLFSYTPKLNHVVQTSLIFILY
jgi:hypothetical protein